MDTVPEFLLLSTLAWQIRLGRIQGNYSPFNLVICVVSVLYQLPLILTALLHVAWYTLSISRHVFLSDNHDVKLFEWRRQWHWIDTKIDNYVIIASLSSASACKLINRIPGLRLLISSLPGLALRTHVESLGKPRDVNKRSQSIACLAMSTSVLKTLPGKLDIKRHSPGILYTVFTFSKPS